MKCWSVSMCIYLRYNIRVCYCNITACIVMCKSKSSTAYANIDLAQPPETLAGVKAWKHMHKTLLMKAANTNTFSRLRPACQRSVFSSSVKTWHLLSSSSDCAKVGPYISLRPPLPLCACVFQSIMKSAVWCLTARWLSDRGLQVTRSKNSIQSRTTIT